MLKSHEAVYVRKRDSFASSKVVTLVNEAREEVPKRMQFHFKDDLVVAYIGKAWNFDEIADWALPPVIDDSGRATRIYWTI